MKTSNPDAYFCRKLRELREASGLTVEEFCKQYNLRFDGRLNKSTVSRYENGLQEPMISTVKKMADFFGIDPSALLGYDQKPAAPDHFTELARLLDQLNEEGREKLLDYAADLVASGRYIKTDTTGMVYQSEA